MPMKKQLVRFKKSIATLVLLAGGIPALHADAAADQIAMQLGAIQLGITATNVPYDPSNADLTNGAAASAYKQGALALATTTANYANTAFVYYTNNIGTNNPMPAPQTDAYRSQYYAAVQNALNAPQVATINKQNVTTFNPKSKSIVVVKNVTATLNPTLTTPTLVLQAAIADMPNYALGLVNSAVAATMAGSMTNGVFIPVWGAVPKPSAAILASETKLNSFNQKTASTQLTNAGKAASAALTATCKAYAKGTVNWQGWPSNGVTNANGYLPNFGTTTNGPKGGTVSQIQTPNLTGLADSASAVAANAINGLGAFNTNSSALYGKTQANVQSITQQLITAAKAFQKTSTTTVGNTPFYASGALGASSFGITAQVSGDQNESWGGQATPDSFTLLLNGVVRGAVTAVGKTQSAYINAIAVGVAQAFTSAYLQTTYNANGTFVTLNQFLQDNVNNSSIAGAFIAAGASSTLFSGANNPISVGVNQAWNSFNQTNGTWNLAQYPMAGAKGVNLQLGGTNALINGVGTPVTDTVGM